MPRQRFMALALLGALCLPALALAEACTYREALMALEQGNTVRGMALLRMASRDGDPRARRHLASLRGAGEQPVPRLPRLALQGVGGR